MSTATRPVAVPEQLAEWQPSCDMFAGYAPPCREPAIHALVTHGGCNVRLACGPCYRRFLTAFADWLSDKPESHVVVCHTCRAHLDNPWVALHLEPL